MIKHRDHLSRPLLARAFGWIKDLRWVAGVVILVGGLVQLLYGWWDAPGVGLLALGAGVLLANVCFEKVHRNFDWKNASDARTIGLAWIELVTDLLALTVILLWTGALHSPVLGLIILHMLFASLTMPWIHAYTLSALVMGFVTSGLWLMDLWPRTFEERALATGFMMTLPLAVFLSNRLSHCMFEQEYAKRQQRRAARRMRRKLMAQRKAMIQHEKLVSLGQLTAGVAHEISNPLASMDALLQVLQRKPDRCDQQAFEDLREQVRRIQRTVRTLTGIAHPELGERAEADLNDVVESTMRTLEYDHRMRRVEAVLELDEQNPIVSIVTRAMVQVLMNLIINALDALEDQIDSRLILRTEVDGEWALVHVIDNGPGFEPDRNDHIFKPFVTTKPVGKGTGLGLPISLALVRDHGGELVAQSQPHTQTTFSVRIPLLRTNPVVAGHEMAESASR
ncbi:MAG: sensor histidine kinase [Planctomycetota bacterium]|jgi:signal transduction histidine kinase